MYSGRLRSLSRLAVLRWLVIACVIALSIPGAVHAQGGWTITYDFTAGLHDWAIDSACGVTAGSQVNGYGIYGVGTGGTPAYCLYPYLIWPVAAGTVTDIAIDFQIVSSVGGTSAFLRAWDNPGFSGSPICTFAGGLGIGEGYNGVATFSGIACSAARAWEFAIQDDGQPIIRSIVFTGYSDIPITQTPSNTPTPTATVGTPSSSGLLPTFDGRPLCTFTPGGTSTFTVTPTHTPVPALATMVAAVLTAAADITPYYPYGTPRPPTSTPTITPTFIGGCQAPRSFTSVGQDTDVGITDYRRDEEGEIVENCYTLLPAVDIGDTLQGAINTLFGSTVLETSEVVEQVDLCVKYRIFTVKILGIDLATPFQIMLAAGLISWLLWTLQRDL